MDGNITVKYLQDYLRQKDFKPGQEREYFLKLAEEVGEMARAMHKGLRRRVRSGARLTRKFGT